MRSCILHGLPTHLVQEFDVGTVYLLVIPLDVVSIYVFKNLEVQFRHIAMGPWYRVPESRQSMGDVPDVAESIIPPPPEKLSHAHQ